MNKKVKVYAFLLLVALFGSQIPILASGTDKTQKTPNKVSISENSSQEQYQDSSNQPQKDTNPQPSAVNAPFVLHNESWDKNYGDANHDIAFAVKECVNGDLLIAGETEIDGTGYYDMLLIRTDAEGNQLWKKSYGWPSVHEAAFDVIECENGDIVIAGYRNMAGWGQQTWIVRTNSSGDIQYNSFPGGYDDDYVRAIVECKNGSLAAVGSTLSFGADSYDIYLILMYPNCTLLDQRAYFTSGVQKGYGLVQCDDEGFAISGHSGGWPMFMRTDRNLNQIDYDLYSFDGRGGIHYSIVKCREGGFAMTGYVDQSGTPFDYAMTLFRIDDDGNELWKKIYGGVARDEGSALVELQEGGFAMVGVQHSWWVPPHGGAQFWLVRTDEYGNRLWDQVYQNHGSTWAFALTQCANSDLVLAGWTNGDWGTGFGDYDAYVVRVPLKVYRAPITINSWTELESLNEGFLGDGSASNPFAIGDWIINTPSINHSLALVDITNASIMIEYCELTGASNGAGLLLSNINHATISNNDCHGNRYGIICSYTDDITIENTVCSENSQTGIYLIWATNSELKHCNSVENQNGLKFTYDSTGNVVQNCSFINNHEFGFYVDSASHTNTMNFNIFEDNQINVWDNGVGSVNDFDYNYYSDYAGSGPHPIPGDASNEDPHPLIIPPGRPALSWIETPVNQLLEELLPFHYDLNVTAYRGVDLWWINDTSNFSISMEGVITNNVSLLEGVYGLAVWVNDTAGTELNANFTVFVQKGVPPIWDPEPEDQDLEYGTRLYYDLNATDPAGIDQWWVNDTGNFSIDSSTGLLTDVVQLSIGEYGLQVWVNDTTGAVQTANFTITVQDNQPPSWIEPPLDQFIEYPNGLYLDLNATDPSGIDAWWINDTIIFIIDNFGIITNITTVNIGAYGIQVWVNDSQNHIQTATITVIIQDTIAPIWTTTPTHQYFEGGIETVDFQLEAWDPSGIAQWSINDTTHFQISTSGRVTETSTLPLGRYDITVIAYDPYDNPCTAVFTVFIQDTTPPAWITVPSDQTVEFGSPFQLALGASDYYGVDTWWINDTTRFSISPSGSIANTTHLAIGEYGIEVRVTDVNGQTQLATFKVLVQDTTLPIWITFPTNLSIVQGEQLGIQLEAFDLSGISQWTLNGTSYFTLSPGGYLSSQENVPLGTHLLTISIVDNAGNSISSTMIITVSLNPTTILVAGLGIVVTIVAGSLIYILYIRRKREKIHSGGEQQ